MVCGIGARSGACCSTLTSRSETRSRKGGWTSSGAFQEVLNSLSSMTRPSRLSWRERLALWFAPANDLFSSRDNVHRHYDLGNDFYALWLDSQLVYTCACFPTPDLTLEAAQIAKLDLVCRKLARNNRARPS